MVNITEVVTISVTDTPDLAAYDNVNAVTIITSEAGFLSTKKRYAIYKSLSAVANDFGTHSKAYQYAASFFATTPNPANAGGYLIIGFWRALDEVVPATSAFLKSMQLSEAATIGNLQSISDGSFKVTVDSADIDVLSLDFRTTTNLLQAAALINANTELSAVATCEFYNESLIIKSLATGVASQISATSAATAGTYVGDLLCLSAGSGSTLEQGADEATLPAESKLGGITALRARVFFAGALFIDKPIDADVPALAMWGQANKVLQYDVFSTDEYSTIDVSNPVWAVKSARQTYYRCLGSKANNRLMAASYMSRVHTVLFAGQNVAMTMNLKALSVTTENYTLSEVHAAKVVGLALYSSIKKTSVVLDSGANDYVDNVYNKLALQNEVQVNVFNVLKSTNTKIAQTTGGVSSLVTAIDKTMQKFVRAGVISAGTWNSTDTFGDLATFKRSIEQSGFYTLAGLIKDQPELTRTERKSPVIQSAVKFAGAIEHVDLLINVEY